MLKRIPKSDISIRPFKAYKQWDFNQASSEIALLEANETSSVLSGQFPKKSIYGQLRAQYYNGNEDNPFLRFGNKGLEYNIQQSTRDRFLSGSAKVISIPQIYVGEGIQKGSVRLIDGLSSFADDSNGNIVSALGDSVTFGHIDLQTIPGKWDFLDIANAAYSGSFQGGVNQFNAQFGTFDVVYNSVNYSLKIVTFDMNTGVMIVENIPFLTGAAGSDKIGNVFYANGLIVLTRDTANLLQGSWDLTYKSTETIYEHEYLLIVNEDEFNVSQNPTAIVEVGKETSEVSGTDGKTYKVTTNPGVKYIRKKTTLETGDVLDYRFGSSVNNSISGGFEHYDLSGSVDSTGSFLLPFITTIGLYDDNCDLVAVAKLPQPIKSEHDIPVNFIVRFDT